MGTCFSPVAALSYLAPLEPSFTVVYYDPRGSGKSSRPTQESKMSTLYMADDLEGFRSYLGLDKIPVLGHSHGAQIAAIFTAKHPDRVSHLIFVTRGLSQERHPEGEPPNRRAVPLKPDLEINLSVITIARKGRKRKISGRFASLDRFCPWGVARVHEVCPIVCPP